MREQSQLSSRAERPHSEKAHGSWWAGRQQLPAGHGPHAPPCFAVDPRHAVVLPNRRSPLPGLHIKVLCQARKCAHNGGLVGRGGLGVAAGPGCKESRVVGKLRPAIGCRRERGRWEQRHRWQVLLRPTTGCLVCAQPAHV